MASMAIGAIAVQHIIEMQKPENSSRDQRKICLDRLH